MSNEQKKFILKNKKYKYLVLFTQILFFLILIFTWQFLSDKKIINSFISSSPKNIINTTINLYKQKNLFIHIFITLKETLISFTLTTIISLIISIILYKYKFISDVIEPYLIILGSLPKVALGPIIIIWIGANTKAIITVAILISIIVSIQSIYNGFIQTDKLKIKLLQTLGASKKDILMYVVLPSNKQTILSTLKINISMCLIGLLPLVGEKVIII